MGTCKYIGIIRAVSLAVMMTVLSAPVRAQLGQIHDLGAGFANDHHGAAIAGGGDVNADGVPDVIIGAKDGGAFGQGVVRVMSGLDGSQIWIRYGAFSSDDFGFAVAIMPDVDGDGHDEFVVGSPLADTNGADSGAVYVYSGATGLLLYQEDGATGEKLGFSVAVLRDFSGDGQPDIAMGAPDYTNGLGDQVGRVKLIHGVNGATITTLVGSEHNERYGHAVGDGGDMRGNGLCTVLIGAPGFDGVSGANRGRVEAWGRTFTNQPAPSTDLLFTIEGGAPGDQYGYAVAGNGGDIDGDGLADAVVGAPGFLGGGTGGHGAVHAIAGPLGAQIHMVIGNASSSLGASVAAGGDLNGDGYADFAGGAPGLAVVQTPGVVTAFSGFDGQPLGDYIGTGTFQSFGASCAFVGDLNGDGTDDLAAGDPNDNEAYALGLLPMFPGSGDDFVLESGINAPSSIAPDLKAADLGDVLSLRVATPRGTYAYTIPVLAGQLLTAGQVVAPTPGFPEVWLDQNDVVVIFDGLQPGLPPKVLPPQGLDFVYVVSAQLSGLRARFQAFSLTPGSSNPIFTASGAQEIQFN